MHIFGIVMHLKTQVGVKFLPTTFSAYYFFSKLASFMILENKNLVKYMARRNREIKCAQNTLRCSFEKTIARENLMR